MKLIGIIYYAYRVSYERLGHWDRVLFQKPWWSMKMHTAMNHIRSGLITCGIPKAKPVLKSDCGDWLQDYLVILLQ